TLLYYAANNGHIDVLRLLIKAGANINTLSQHGRIAASSVSVILSIANVLKFLIELRAYTPPIVRVLAYIRRLKKN
ncbi:hypothetical protein V2W45_1232476, partial [Cenococcum geophilum]